MSDVQYIFIHNLYISCVAVLCYVFWDYTTNNSYVNGKKKQLRRNKTFETNYFFVCFFAIFLPAYDMDGKYEILHLYQVIYTHKNKNNLENSTCHQVCVLWMFHTLYRYIYSLHILCYI